MNFSNCIKYSGYVAISQNSEYIAISKGNNVLIYLSKDLSLFKKYNFGSNITQIIFSPNDEYILIGLYSQNKIILKHINDENINISVTEEAFGISNSIFTPDNSYILIYNNILNRIHVISLIDQEFINKYIYNPKFIDKGICFDNNNFFLMALAERKDVKDFIGIYYLGDFSLQCHFNVNTNDLENILFTKDNCYIIVYESLLESKIFIYSINGNLLMINEAYNNNNYLGINNVIISPNGHFITASYYDNNVRIFNYMNFKLSCILKHNFEDILKENKNNKYLNVLKENNFGNFEKIDSNDLLNLNINNNNNKNVFEESNILEYSFDSNYLCVKLSNFNNILYIWNINELKLLYIIIFNNKINDFKWSPNELILIIGTNNNYQYLFNIINLIILELNEENFNVNKIKWNNNGKNFILLDKYKLFIGFSNLNENNEKENDINNNNNN